MEVCGTLLGFRVEGLGFGVSGRTAVRGLAGNDADAHVISYTLSKNLSLKSTPLENQRLESNAGS